MNTKIFIKNENSWVATDRKYKNLLAFSRSLDVLQKKIKKLKINDAIVMFVPPFNKIFAP